MAGEVVMLDMSSSSESDNESLLVAASGNNCSNTRKKSSVNKGVQRNSISIDKFTENDLKKPEKMKLLWELAYKQILILRKKLRTTQQKNRRLEGQIARAKNLIQHLKHAH